MARLRVASNSPCAAGRSYYTFDVSARIRGLCPHVKYPRLCRGIFIIVYTTAGCTVFNEFFAKEALLRSSFWFYKCGLHIEKTDSCHKCLRLPQFLSSEKKQNFLACRSRQNMDVAFVPQRRLLPDGRQNRFSLQKRLGQIQDTLILAAAKQQRQVPLGQNKGAVHQKISLLQQCHNVRILFF